MVRSYSLQKRLNVKARIWLLLVHNHDKNNTNQSFNLKKIGVMTTIDLITSHILIWTIGGLVFPNGKGSKNCTIFLKLVRKRC